MVVVAPHESKVYLYSSLMLIVEVYISWSILNVIAPPHSDFQFIRALVIINFIMCCIGRVSREGVYGPIMVS